MANENKITLGDLRFMFDGQTRIYLTCEVWTADEMAVERIEKLEITNALILWGTSEFCNIPVYPCNIKAAGKNKIEIMTRMPYVVFKAWADYAKKGE